MIPFMFGEQRPTIKYLSNCSFDVWSTLHVLVPLGIGLIIDSQMFQEADALQTY